MRFGIARTRIGGAVIRFFFGMARRLEFAFVTDEDIAIFACASTSWANEVF